MLAQVHQHSGARKLRFTLNYARDEAQMSIEDDGVPSEQAPLSMFAGDAPTSPAPPFSSQQNGRDASPLRCLFLAAQSRRTPRRLARGHSPVSSKEPGAYNHSIRSPLARFGPRRLRTSRLPRTLVSPSHYQWPGLFEPPVRILIVDNQPVTRAGLRRLLESYTDLEVVGEAVDGVQAVSETVELGTKVGGGRSASAGRAGALRQIKQLTPIHTCCCSPLQSRRVPVRDIARRRRGRLRPQGHRPRRTRAGGTLSGARRSAGAAADRRSPDLALRQARTRRNPRYPDCTRNRGLALVARGLRNKEIAARLFVSERTVNFHLANIYQKRNVSGRTEALSKAHEQGLITA